MLKEKRIFAVMLAFLAAGFYAMNTPFSKILLEHVGPAMMATFLYLGAGIGVGILYLFHFKKEKKSDRLTRSDLPYTIGMIALDIAAPIFMMMGLMMGSAANASLLGNFEIVATTMIAFILFHEKVSVKLWLAIGFITLASIILSFEGVGSFQFSIGSAFVIIATCCWGLENNCTRKISEKSTHQIVVIKGIFSGVGSLIVARLMKEPFPMAQYIVFALALGFVAYGLSIFMYIRAQRILGAAKTSAYYAIAPFIGTFLAFIINGEQLTVIYFIGFVVMVIGSVFVVMDTLHSRHNHAHTHTIEHCHHGHVHSHTFTHAHWHNHFGSEDAHTHRHDSFLNSKYIGMPIKQ